MAQRTLQTACLMLALGAGAMADYVLNQTWQGETFFDHFNFMTETDPTEGTVSYKSQADSIALGLINTSATKAWMRVDSTTVLSGSDNRPSVRIESKEQFTYGLFVISLTHEPTGCATWPAFWMYGPSWPAGGEIDIIEYVDVMTTVQTTLHTSANCTMDAQTSTSTNPMTGTWTSYTDCWTGAYNGANDGCATLGAANSAGAPFNAKGGGVFATLVNSSVIAVWHWDNNTVPADLYTSAPQPNSWGEPQSRFPLGSWCTPGHFSDMWIVFDITLCGDWEGAVFGTNCPSLGSSWSDCNAFVRANASAFKEAYFEIDWVKIFLEEQSSASTSASSQPAAAASSSSTSAAAGTASSSAVQSQSQSKSAATSQSTGGAAARRTGLAAAALLAVLLALL